MTSFQDHNVRSVDVIRAYAELAQQGKMKLRGNLYYTLEWERDLNTALKEIEPFAEPFMRFSGYKFLIDGQAPFAFTHWPHSGKSWNMPTWEPATFKRAVRALHHTGLQIAVHCLGDAAVDLTQDAHEEAMRAHTMGSAYATLDVKTKGSIEDGKTADRVVWTGDPYRQSVPQLANATTDFSMVGGKVVHQRA